jgi:formate dehydrogenase assembly factor FdhD
MRTALNVQPVARARAPLPGGPRLSEACGELLRTVPIADEYADHRLVEVPVERPLCISLDGRSVATLWTLGASAEWLVLGYLWTRQFVSDVTAIESISINWADGVAQVKSRGARAAAGRACVAGFCRADRHRSERQASARRDTAACTAAEQAGIANHVAGDPARALAE